MELTENQKTIIDTASNISYLEWIRVSNAIQRAFEEKERSARKKLKFDAERVFHYAENP